MLENKDRISVRLTAQEKRLIDLLVSVGLYKNKSSFLRQAIENLLKIETVKVNKDEHSSD